MFLFSALDKLALSQLYGANSAAVAAAAAAAGAGAHMVNKKKDLNPCFLNKIKSFFVKTIKFYMLNKFHKQII